MMLHMKLCSHLKLLFTGACVASLALATGCALISGEPRPLSARQLERLEQTALEVDIPDGYIGKVNGTRIRQHFHRTDGEFSIVATKVGGEQRLLHSLIKIEIAGDYYLAVIDTGSPFTVISHQMAVSSKSVPVLRDDAVISDGESRLEFERLRGLGGQRSVIVATMPQVGIGGKNLEHIPVKIVNARRGLGEVESIGAHHVDMLIGNDFLSRFRSVMFDFKSGKIEFFTDENVYETENMTCVELISTAPVPIVRGTIADNPSFPVVIDTGSDKGLWLPRSLYEQLTLFSLSDTYIRRRGRGFGGATQFKDITPHALTIDSLVIRNLPISVEISDENSSSPPYALLGQRALRRYRVLIDYSGRMIYFEKIPFNHER